MRNKGIWTFGIVLLIATSIFANESMTNAVSDKAFLSVTNDYIDHFYFPSQPTASTQLGVHLYDDKLEDYTKKGITRQISLLKNYETRMLGLDYKSLSNQAQGDYDLVLNHIRSDLLTLEKIKPLEKNPDSYSSGLSYSIYVIIERQFASIEDRLRLVIAREKFMPAVLDAARENLNNPPKIFTEVALEQLPGIIQFFQKDVPSAFEKVNDPELKKQFNQSNSAVINALISYQAWLKNKLLPQSHGDFRIGEQTFLKKLQYDDMVDMSLPMLLKIGWKNLRENQSEFIRLSKKLYPDKSTKEVLAILVKSHPSSDQLMSSFSGKFDDLITFIKDKKIISIPSDIRPTMIETPPFMRATTIASMDTPGPFESKTREAYFDVTLPDPAWTQEEQEDFMGAYNYPDITMTAAHEAYPGHYLQFLWMNQIHDRIRQIFGANTNAEGWAHYCEQMILDEGFGKGKLSQYELDMLRLGQLFDALLRNARFIVGIEMHTGKMSFNQAVKFFENEGFQPHSIAVLETKRGTSDPMYLYYTLGKLQILQLRDEVKAKQGARFSLQKFHDDFMRQGFPPIKIVRSALLQ